MDNIIKLFQDIIKLLFKNNKFSPKISLIDSSIRINFPSFSSTIDQTL